MWWHIFFIHSPVTRSLGWFHISSILDSTAINMDVQVSVWFDLESIGYTLRDTAKLYGSSIFNSLKNLLKDNPGNLLSVPCLSGSVDIVLNLPSFVWKVTGLLPSPTSGTIKVETLGLFLVICILFINQGVRVMLGMGVERCRILS